MPGIPVPLSRFIVLILTPAYLVLLTAILDRVSPADFRLLAAIVFVGAAVQCAIIVVLSVKAERKQPAHFRFSIGTLLLVTVALSLYMAYIREFISAAKAETTHPVTLYGIATVSFASLFFIVISTIVLIHFTEALLATVFWLVKAVRKFSR